MSHINVRKKGNRIGQIVKEQSEEPTLEDKEREEHVVKRCVRVTSVMVMMITYVVLIIIFIFVMK